MIDEQSQRVDTTIRIRPLSHRGWLHALCYFICQYLGSHRKKLGQQGKPLAILASLDLRRPSDKSGVKEKPDETTASGVGPITVTERHDNDSSEVRMYILYTWISIIMFLFAPRHS